jgi:aromatic ring-opening dioxygenase catalytic subunit (LigB family)
MQNKHQISPIDNSRSSRQPTYYLSHGGGPWSFMRGQFQQIFRPLGDSLIDIPNQLPGLPSAVLVMSGHWETADFTISTAEMPTMLYDYNGFPEAMYRITYPAPGQPHLAETVATMLEDAGWTVKRDAHRGYDHGTFSLMKAIFPNADIPIVQLSMKTNLDPLEHFEAGKAVSLLRDQNILILGSGQSFHNLAAHGLHANQMSLAFDRSLRHALLRSTSQTRFEELLNCINSTYGQYAHHPRADHLIPLLFALGAAEKEPAHCVFSNYLMDFATSSYAFSDTPIETPLDTLYPLESTHPAP